MNLTKWKKNFYPTVGLLIASLVGLGYLGFTHHTGGRMLPIVLLVTFALIGYMIYMIREKRKLQRESKERKSK